MQARREQIEVFTVEVFTVEFRLLYAPKLPFQSKGDIKIFSNKTEGIHH